MLLMVGSLIGTVAASGKRHFLGEIVDVAERRREFTVRLIRSGGGDEALVDWQLLG